MPKAVLDFEKPIVDLETKIEEMRKYSDSLDLAGETRTSAFSLYEDDGLSIAYRSGEFQRTELRLSQTAEAVRFDVSLQNGDGKFQSVARRGYRLHFHGIDGAVKVVRLDGQAIAEADADSGAGARAAWSKNEWSGDVSVFVPPSAPRASSAEWLSRDT